MSRYRSTQLIFVAAFFLLFGSTLHGETKIEQIPEPAEAIQGSRGLETVIASFRTLRAKEKEILAKLETLKQAKEPNTEEIANAEAAELQIKEALEKVKTRIREVVAGVEATTEDLQEEAFNLNDEFNNLAKPIVDELKEASKEARVLSELRASISKQVRRGKILNDSLERVQLAKQDTTDEEILSILDNLKAQIDGEIATVNAKLATEQFRYDTKIANQEGWPRQLLDSIIDFIQGRGLIMLLAFFTAFITFFSLAFLHRQLFRRVGRKGNVGSSFGFRIAELTSIVLRTVATITTVVLLFLAFDDWVLITIAIIIIIGLLWGAKKTFVESYHRLQLLLNLGQVRQGERVTWNGLPYQVRALGFFPLLENPALTNSIVRITVEELAELRMRHVTENEPWFVTETGNWALLSDGSYGKITYQSPERVSIQDPGGHTKTMPTEDYLALHPTNLSHGYALATTFGIDYSHQSLDCGMVADTFAKSVRTRVLEHCSEDEILAVFAAFKEANTSSLDYIIVTKLKGSADDRRLPLSRALQRGCLDACNENGWTIPFPQLVVHSPTKP